MRLKTVKLSGFKSFVDPTTVPVSSDLIGIVGPNGCGKSNIIDAVRWVMGESSARHLRGDSMADVIFNGSSARKPVGQASVELVFDNSDGGVGGQYARYSEISIRREAARDGRSDYFLNKTRCRRKDITDLLLGTGLGPRAYSIIEQDMVSRIVESKPEDLRAFFEEAAGISKYRERRRETENRMRHAHENLARVQDIRQELDTQLRRLKRQSRAAARFKELKADERLARAQWLALRWRALDIQVREADRIIAGHEIELEGAIAEQRGIESNIEKIRSEQAGANEQFNSVQAEFYSVGTEIAGIEQSIEHTRETQQQRTRELEQVNQTWTEASANLQSDRQRLGELERALAEGGPRLETGRRTRAQAAQQLRAAEAAMSAWQQDWDGFAEVVAEVAKACEIQRVRSQQLQQHIGQVEERARRLDQELEQINLALGGDELGSLQQQERAGDAARAELEQQLHDMERGIADTRTREVEIGRQSEAVRGDQHRCDARLASLRELQAAAEGRYDAALNEWLTARGLHQAPRLAGLLAVESGWEQAVESVLGTSLTAVCVERLDPFAAELENDAHADVALFDLHAVGTGAAPGKRPTLLEKIKARADLAPLLAGVYVNDKLSEALAARGKLAAHESIVTRTGVWVGRNWLRVAGAKSERSGMLAREREIDQLEQQSRALHERLGGLDEEHERVRSALAQLEREQSQCRERLHAQSEQHNELHARRVHQEARLTQLRARAEQIDREQREVREQVAGNRQELEEAHRLLRRAEEQGSTHTRRRRELVGQRDELQTQLEHARMAAEQAQEALHRLEVERERLQAAFDSTRQNVTRLEAQLEQLFVRRDELQRIVSDEQDPEETLRERLDAFLQQRLQIEQRLNDARRQASELETALRSQEQARSQQQQRAQEIRQVHEEARIQRQELITRRDGLAEQVREGEFELQEVVAGLPEEATEESWHARIDELHARIERLGAINLVAIEEFEEQSKRKQYLDKQHQDLVEALATLEEAIRKMDRETRVRFKETFDKVNSGFQAFFPRLFGGGSAYLELTESDLLTSGVTLMARPPGKRNSTIHLLSGGEKALTAVALLFALFELNPAPFCLLDEVDASLDDANVERYCETLAALSEKTQLIYVTHNKISMETARVLVGVTMTEPGVSRLVAVDVDQALQMAAR